MEVKRIAQTITNRQIPGAIDDHKENGFKAGRVSRADGSAKKQTDLLISGQDSVCQWDKSGFMGGLSFLR